MPDPGGCSQQMLLEARIPAIAKSIAIAAAAAEDHGGHSQLVSWLLFVAGTGDIKNMYTVFFGLYDAPDHKMHLGFRGGK